MKSRKSILKTSHTSKTHKKSLKKPSKSHTNPHPPDDKFAELYELQDKYNTLLIEYNAKPTDAKHTELLAIMRKINVERTRINPYYPAISDELFNGKLSVHPLFNKYTIPYDKTLINDFYHAYNKNTGTISRLRDAKSEYFVLKPSQNFLANFMSPYSPYRGLFIIHGTGVGKSCTAITIAEQMKLLVKNSETSIFILRPEAMESAIFDPSKIKSGKPLMQCTHDTYFINGKAKQQAEDCMNGNNEECERMMRTVQKERDKYYTLVGSRKWANDVNKLINDKVKDKTGLEREERISQVIHKYYDNAVIIIDEAHKLRDNSTGEDKIVPPVLRQVLSVANNIRLILMTATPIFDKPQDIISLINYLLVNDRRPQIDSNAVFEADGTLKAKGRNILIENTRGYVSYLRGNNPFDFPLRIPAKLVVPEQVLDPRKYPKQDLYGNIMKPFEPIKYLNIIDCPMEGEQRKIFDKFSKTHKIVINDDDFTNDLEYELEVPVNDTEFSELSAKLDAELDIKTSGLNPALISNSSTIPSQKLSHHSKTVKNSLNIPPVEILEDDMERSVAHSDELQIGDFVYQSLEETSGNTKLCYGGAGLRQICSRVGRSGPISYKFNDESEYARRFKMPELGNWSSKLARLIKNIENAKGPVFIYTRFLAAGAIPIAFALEMAGYKRYRMHNSPLLQYSGKSPEYKGDYIIYSGDPKISQYAQTYIEKGSSMMRDNVKVFIGTQKVCEGISLFGYREAHILEPWHNINLIEQSIGRAIRTLSHAELPPQERNVTVYLYAATLGNRESVDLKIYKISENKAIKAGSVEKLLKENAIDCAPYENGNTFSREMFPEPVPIITSNGKTIKFNIADEPFTPGCFYQDTCDFKCMGQLENDKQKKEFAEQYNIPIQTENYVRDRDGIIALLTNLLREEPNIDISLAKKRLNITSINEHSFNSAIEVLINTQQIIKDKKGKDNMLLKHMNILRLVPVDMKYSDIPMQQQYLTSQEVPISSINLESYISILGKEKKELSETLVINYKQIIDNFNSIINNPNTFKTNLDISYNDRIWILFCKLTYNEKFAILKYLLTKIIKFARNNNGHHPVLSNIENLLEPCVMRHVIYVNNIYPSMASNNIHGFMILNEDKLDYYSYSDIEGEFVKDQGNIRKVIEYKRGLMVRTPNSKIYGFLKYDNKGGQPVFKIRDQLQKGDKKSVKGINCSSKMINDIRSQIELLDKNYAEKSKSVTKKDMLCNNIEYVFYEKDMKLQGGNKWFYTPEENFIYFGL